MRVLVTGTGGPAGASVANQLSYLGIEVVGTDMALIGDQPGVHQVLVPAATDPGFVPTILDLMDEFAVDLVIPTVSDELPYLAELDPRIVVPARGSVLIAHDKWLTHCALTQARIPAPRTAVAENLNDQVADWLGRPYVVKPRVGRGGRGVGVHTESFQEVPISTADIVCEFVPGLEYCPNLYIADDPRDDVAIVLRKTRLAGGHIGTATGVVRDPVPAVAKLALAAARAVKLTGPVDVDIRLRANGQPVVLELNARFGTNSAHAPEVLAALLAERRQFACAS